MSVFRRGKRLVIDYRPDGRYGKRVRFTLPEEFQDEDEARGIEADMKRAARDPQAENLSSTTTVREAFPEYIEHCKLHKAPGSSSDIEYAWHAHFERILGDYRVSEIGIHHITLYKRFRKAERIRPKKKNAPPGKPISNRTINKELSYFSGFLRWCEENHNIKRQNFHIQALPAKRPVPMPLSIEECLAIIEKAEPIYQGFILCLFALGLRKAEARNLRRSDIDRVNHTLKVVQKGGGEKVLPAGEWLVSILDAIDDQAIRKGSRAKTTPKPNTEGYVFFNRRTGRPVYDYRKAINRAAKKAGVTKRVTPHIFRHSVGKFLVDQNVNLRVIQRYLGHQRVSTTEIYTQVELESLRGAESAIFKSMEEFLRKRDAKGH